MCSLEFLFVKVKVGRSVLISSDRPLRIHLQFVFPIETQSLMLFSIAVF